MDWKPGKWKFNFRGSKDKWLVVLAIGLIFLILAFPAGRDGDKAGGSTQGREPASQTVAAAYSLEKLQEGEQEKKAEAASLETGAKGVVSYEQQLEARLKELLSHVEGVGEVEVMIVLKSSEEKVWRVDRNTSYSSTQETDSNGGTRDSRSQNVSEVTILSGGGEGEGPLLEKELRPEISGVVVSASGGGSPKVQAEISGAVEALFDVPSHKIKVLKRAE